MTLRQQRARMRRRIAHGWLSNSQPSPPIHILSLGAGVQSSTMALMAAAREITPMPFSAVFSDTGWERKKTYEWLDWLEKQLPFPVARVNNGDLRSEQILARGRGRAIDGVRWVSLPYFTLQDGAVTEGRVKRQCTTEYKIEPCERWMKREVLKLAPGSRLPTEPVIIQWRGISTDEASRLKDSREPWYSVRYPLALELRMSRADCIQWMLKNFGVIPPRSACIGCPFHSDTEWRDIKNNPVEWADAVAFDHAIRKAGGMRGETFLHRSCKPLEKVDLSTEEERGQIDMFNNECEGMCGL